MDSRKTTFTSPERGHRACPDDVFSRSVPDGGPVPGPTVQQADSRQEAMLPQPEQMQIDRAEPPPPRQHYPTHILESPNSWGGSDQKYKSPETFEGSSMHCGEHQIVKRSSGISSRCHDRGNSAKVVDSVVKLSDREERRECISVTAPIAVVQSSRLDGTHPDSEMTCLCQQQLYRAQKGLDTLQKVIDQKDKDISRFQEEHQASTATHKREMREAQYSTARLQSTISQNKRSINGFQAQLHASKTTHERDMLEAKETIAKLQGEIDKRDQSIDDMRTHAMAQLASDNSSAFPDDQIERSFRRLFSGEDFQGWVEDNNAAEIRDPETIVRTLLHSGVLVPSQHKAARHLERLQTLSTGFMQALVEGALVRDLCQRFLSNPFFQFPHLLHGDIQKRANTEPFIEWRVHTYEVLGREYDQDPGIFRKFAHEFLKTNQSILRPQPLNEEALDELVGFYKDFASLSQKLWMLKTRIAVEGLEQPCFRKFSHADMLPHELIKSSHGPPLSELNGKHVRALVRPRIVSWPLRNRCERGVVWSEAVVWM